MKYVTFMPKPETNGDWRDQPPIAAANTIYEPEDDPKRTGLIDQNGTQIYRVKDKIGYI